MSISPVRPVVVALAYILPEVAFGFTLFLDNGFFYGPGNAVYNDTGRIGVNKFVDAEVIKNNMTTTEGTEISEKIRDGISLLALLPKHS